MTPTVSRKEIAEKAAEAFGLSLLDLVSARRSADVVTARRVAWLLIKEFRPDTSTPEIGLLFNRDHSTVVVGLQEGRKRLVNDVLFREAVQDVRKALMKWPVAAPGNGTDRAKSNHAVTA